jgi:para-aminobenzoate synthetase component I
MNALAQPDSSSRRAKAIRTAMTFKPHAIIEDGRAGRALPFHAPAALITAREPEEIAPAFAAMEAARREGLWLAGYASYELGYVLEPKLRPLLPTRRAGPLLCFGAFAAPGGEDWTASEGAPAGVTLDPDWDAADYTERFDKVIAYIRAGDVYQINLTFPMRGRFHGDPLALYARLRARQPVALGGVFALGEETIVCCSPELFFETEGRSARVRPMKGTERRGYGPQEDMWLARLLMTEEKARAENLMIVDLLRNDLGRLAEIGSVTVTDLFTVAAYPTLHQMTSGIEARLREGLTLHDLFKGLFPCGSVTGAPKIRAMEIIRELESAPRGAYCGALGYVTPQGDARFSVGIRTLTIDAEGAATLNVGSAVVADSGARAEYDECLLKASFLTGAPQAKAVEAAISA